MLQNIFFIICLYVNSISTLWFLADEKFVLKLINFSIVRRRPSHTDLSSQGSSGSSHLLDHNHQRGYSHSAHDTPAHRCHPDNEKKTSTVGIKLLTKDGFKAPPQLKEGLQDRTRRNVLPSNRENMCRCHLQGHKQLRWHISMSDYIPDPIYHWNTGWSSPHLANLESERAQEAQAHNGSGFPEDKFEL